METAERLRYTPNRAAVSLATSRSHMIGLIIADLRNTHISTFFMAIDEEVQSSGYTLLCQVLNENKDDVQRMVNDLVSSGVEGIIFSQPALVSEPVEQRSPKEFLDGAGVPVMCNNDFGLSCPGVNICFNYYKGGYLATRHLVECGHTDRKSVV